MHVCYFLYSCTIILIGEVKNWNKYQKGTVYWQLARQDMHKIHAVRMHNVLEMKCLRNLVGVSRMDRVRNEDVRRRAGIERELASRADQRVLRWIGHVERMDEYRMARKVLMAEVSGGRVRGRPRLC